MENFQAEGKWTQGGRSAGKLPGRTGSGGINAGHGDREKRKRFEAAKWRAQGRIARGCELVKRFAGNGEIEDWTASRAELTHGETQGEAKHVLALQPEKAQGIERNEGGSRTGGCRLPGAKLERQSSSDLDLPLCKQGIARRLDDSEY